MKTKFTVIFLAIVLAIGCSKSSDPNPAQSSGTATATINGKAFTATDTKVTDTGNGLDIKIASATETIKILTDANKAGTYTIINSGGRAMAGTSGSASYVVGTDVYLAVSGTVTVTIDASGKVSLTYSITFRNSSGTVITLTDGKLSSATVTAFQVPVGKCLIASVATITSYNSTSSNLSTLVYDSDGHLLRVNSDNGAYELFIWAGGVVTSRIQVSPNGAVDEKQNWFYTNGKLTKVTWYAGNGTSSGTWDYTLNAAGQPTKVVATSTYQTGGTTTYTWNHTYDANGNCTQTISTSPSGNSTITFSGYDTKPNPSSLYLASLGITFTPEAESGDSYSKNNVGKGVSTTSTFTYTYTYNAKGNVETISGTNSSTYGTDSRKDTFSYVGCN